MLGRPIIEDFEKTALFPIGIGTIAKAIGKTALTGAVGAKVALKGSHQLYKAMKLPQKAVSGVLGSGSRKGILGRVPIVGKATRPIGAAASTALSPDLWLMGAASPIFFK